MATGESIRVALVSFGFEEYTLQLANGLSKSAEVFLFLPDPAPASYASRLSPAIHFYPIRRARLRQPLQQIRSCLALTDAIQQINPDVIHLQQGHLWFNFALPFLRSYPLVLTVHDARYHTGDRESQKTPQWITDLAFRRVTRIITHGAQIKQALVDLLSIPSDRINVISHIMLGDIASESNSDEQEGTVLFFGRIWEYKGLEYLIRAEPLITERIPDAKIIIAGEGEDFSRYRRMMIHPERFIVHNEYVSDAKRAELFRRASVIALPYIDASQSGVIPIAYAFAKPVVATTVGSLPEVVEDDETGYLVPPRDEKALAKAIVRLLEDKNLRQRLGENGKRKLLAESSVDVVAEQTLSVYRQAINDRNISKQHRVDLPTRFLDRKNNAS